MIPVNRREFGQAGLGLAMPGLLPSIAIAQGSPGAADPAPPEMVRPWMDTWINDPARPKDLSGQLVVFKFKNAIYSLEKPIRWRPPSNGSLKNIKPVEVPKGFVTDFASIPRIFWSAVEPSGEYAFAAVIHDYVYWKQDRPRSEADAIFRYAMEDLGIKFVVSQPLYLAVDTLGGRAWSKNAQLKAGGEKRILKSTPPDPRTTWDEWKKRGDVFAD